MKKSPFFDLLNRREHVDFAQFLQVSKENEDYINWNQFLLPDHYGDAENEYHAIRTSCALFDVSPMRKYRIQGEDAGAFLDRMLTRRVSSVLPMRCTYVVFCNGHGSLKDDAILQKLAEHDYLLLPSDMDHSTHFETLTHAYGFNNLTINDCTESWVGMAVQGPLSAAVLHQMGFEGIEHLEPFTIRDFQLAAGPIRISRMGFTADLGYECWMSPQTGKAFEIAIKSARESMPMAIPGYGLSALQACRLEGGFIVAGWDCATEADPQPGFERSPFELGLGWLVNLEGDDFVGKDALLKQKENGVKNTLRSFQIEGQHDLDDGVAIYTHIDGQKLTIGQVNCSAWSWGMNRTIGNASLKSLHKDTAEAWVIVAGEELNLSLSRGPLRSFKLSKQLPAPINL